MFGRFLTGRSSIDMARVGGCAFECSGACGLVERAADDVAGAADCGAYCIAGLSVSRIETATVVNLVG